MGFLSTPSARRATQPCGRMLYHWDISIHALRKEGDYSFVRARRTRGHFYPRPPQGGRQIVLAHNLYLLKFLSTPSARRATHL